MIGHIVVYFLFLILLFTFNVINTSYVPFLLLVLFIIVSFISLVMVIILRANTEVVFKDDKVLAIVKDKSEVLLTIRNKSFIPLVRCKIIIQIQYGRRNKKRKYTVKAYCGAKSIKECGVSIDCTNCEVVSVKIKKFYVYDFLNLFCLFKKSLSKSNILVLPQMPRAFIIQKIGYKISNDEEIQYSDKKPGDDATEIFAIRDYAGGDKIRNIHWKLSYKKDKLMVKEYSLPLVDNDVIILDIFSVSGQKNKKINNENETFRLLYGLVCEFLKREYGVRVCFQKDGLNMYEVRNMMDVHHLMEQVYGIIPYRISDGVASLYGESIYNNCQKRFFYISGYYDENAQTSMRLLSNYGKVHYLIPGHTEERTVPVRFEG